jgi:hypothetical protein
MDLLRIGAASGAGARQFFGDLVSGAVDLARVLISPTAELVGLGQFDAGHEAAAGEDGTGVVSPRNRLIAVANHSDRYDIGIDAYGDGGGQKCSNPESMPHTLKKSKNRSVKM